MAKYLDNMQTFRLALKYLGMFHIPRQENTWADTLTRLVTSADNFLKWIYIKYLETLSISETKSNKLTMS